MSATEASALWPLADEVARAIVAASRIEGDDPILVAQGGFAPRSRVYAFLALVPEFPGIDRAALGRMVGWHMSSPFSMLARSAALSRNGLRWFDLDRLNRVRDALGWSHLTIEQAADSALSPRRSLGRASAKRRWDRLERRQEWQSGDPPEIEEAEDLPGPPLLAPSPDQSRAVAVASSPRVTALAEAEAIPSRELTISSEYARGECLFNVTASVCGDPEPARSALIDRTAMRPAEDDLTLGDQAFVAGYIDAGLNDEYAVPESFSRRRRSYRAGWLEGSARRAEGPAE